MDWDKHKKLVKKSERRYNMNPWALIWTNDCIVIRCSLTNVGQFFAISLTCRFAATCFLFLNRSIFAIPNKKRYNRKLRLK